MLIDTSHVIYFSVVDSSNDRLTGQAANLTMYVVSDGTATTTTNSPTEIDSTNYAGIYKITITAGENDGMSMMLVGKCTTVGSEVETVKWSNIDNSELATTVVNRLIASNAVAVEGTIEGVPDESVLYRMIRNVRLYTDEPSSIAKYTEQDIIRMLERETMGLVHDMQKLSRKDITLTHSFDFVTGTKSYKLPNNVGRVLSVAIENEDSGYKTFLYDSSYTANSGTGVYVAANELIFQNGTYLASGTTVTVRYFPQMMSRYYMGTAVLTDGDDQDTITLVDSTLGSKDMLPNAYSGYVMRIIPDESDGILEEEILITNHGGTTNDTLTLAHPVEATLTAGVEFNIEILPPFNRIMEDAIVDGVVLNILGIEGSGPRIGTAKAKLERSKKVLFALTVDRDEYNREEDSSTHSRKNRNPKRFR